MSATLIGYARCSTDRQDLAAQRQALLELGVAEDRIYTDHGLTGTTRNRPIPDRSKGRELRSILWDDEAGTVSGDHSEVGWIAGVFAAPKPVRIGGTGRFWDLSDPAHDSSEFLALIHDIYWPALGEPLRSALPLVFDGVDPPPGEAGEELYVSDPDTGDPVVAGEEAAV